MKYGKLFKKYRQTYGIVDDFTANKCSQLTRVELLSMAKNMYPEHKDILARYMNKYTKELAKIVYRALKSL